MVDASRRAEWDEGRRRVAYTYMYDDNQFVYIYIAHYFYFEINFLTRFNFYYYYCAFYALFFVQVVIFMSASTSNLILSGLLSPLLCNHETVLDHSLQKVLGITRAQFSQFSISFWFYKSSILFSLTNHNCLYPAFSTFQKDSSIKYNWSNIFTIFIGVKNCNYICMSMSLILYSL